MHDRRQRRRERRRPALPGVRRDDEPRARRRGGARGRRDRLARRPDARRRRATTSTGAFVGSEGTLAIATKIVVRLMRAAGVDAHAAGDLRHGRRREQRRLGDHRRGHPAVGAGDDGSEHHRRRRAGDPRGLPARRRGRAADRGRRPRRERRPEQADAIERDLPSASRAREVRVAVDAADRDLLWAGRKTSISALGRLYPNYYVLDGVVPRTRARRGAARRRTRSRRATGSPSRTCSTPATATCTRTCCSTSASRAPRRACWRRARRSCALCVDAGGSITGEHGVGLEKRDFIGWIFDEADLAAMARLKSAFRAGERYNPCKAFPTRRGLRRGDAGARPARCRSDRRRDLCLARSAPRATCTSFAAAVRAKLCPDQIRRSGASSRSRSID